ncbi:copper chaperone PCu(A)C [Pseudooceanicola nanhaiensis]|uniref:copper chaperone PCu(A)C n=1 Tax=Pseudooceanicola nanhaiensis TaxID=375761 RepID=UPI001CD5BD30|nr:copper chaperone PCu(A)C [Pseudooceanicola nanhaiensis]MCA0922290.1 copper chaperone PCu(A)C [Pseudooceanicola nanhaiensis]
MSPNFLRAAVTALILAAPLPALAEGIEVHDAYARAASPIAKSGAAFMVIQNQGATEDDRLIGVASDIAQKVELHTHQDMGGGVMKMVHVEEGFEMPADGELRLERGGKHVMFMGLTRPMKQGESFDLTLTFEKAGDVTITVPVDLERKPEHGKGHMN